MSGKQTAKGAGLLELLVVLSITAVLSILAVPTFSVFIREHRVTAAAQSLYYTLQYARSTAVMKNANTYVNFQTSDNWCYGINLNSSCTCSTANSCGLGTTSTVNLHDITLTATGLSNNSLQFEGTRGATGSSILITFTAYGQSTSMTLKISALGNMSLCSSTISGYPACS